MMQSHYIIAVVSIVLCIIDSSVQLVSCSCFNFLSAVPVYRIIIELI